MFSAKSIFAGVGNLCQFKRFKKLKGFLKVLVTKKFTLGARWRGVLEFLPFAPSGKEVRLWAMGDFRDKGIIG